MILSAEGSGLGRRVEAWMKHYAPAKDVRNLPLLALEKRINLNSSDVLADLQADIEASGMTPALIEVDTYSKYAPGLESCRMYYGIA